MASAMASFVSTNRSSVSDGVCDRTASTNSTVDVTGSNAVRKRVGSPAERGPDGEGPELVDADDMGDDVLHRPPFASAGGRPLLAVELAEERREPSPLPQQRHRRIAERQVELEEQGLVVPRRQQHRVGG